MPPAAICSGINNRLSRFLRRNWKIFILKEYNRDVRTAVKHYFICKIVNIQPCINRHQDLIQPRGK